ncbi:uncharacterized protein LOC124276216 [Haliotis rubra]|uniref:uncharacterized protein LOC124276216 n=1 Tax=Haliotis rubra TaxID=36100 RepID=UPI001EE53F6C|nr:uncharacterized protein LOC124276216 [Haliotis rubra]XP_046567834.1 uncharacterized protein LOC124276216 [Haliotis rubra]
MAPSDDVIRPRDTFLQMTSPEIYSRRFSEFVRHFHGDDFTDASQLRKRLRYTTSFKGELAKLNKRKEPRPGAEPSKRYRKRMVRIGSEPSIFPPISITRSDIGHTSPPTSNVLTVRSDMSTPQATKDDAPSPIPKRETQKSRNTNNLSVDVSKSQEMVRLSPIAFSDRKSKTEGKPEKHASLTPRGSIPKINAKTGLLESQRQERSNSLTDSQNKNERSTTESPHRHRGKGKHSKSKVLEEPFSVRRKIEQYRRWHEEQYLQKLKRLKQDTDSEEKDTPKTDVSGNKESGKRPEIDLAKILEEKSLAVTVKPVRTIKSGDENNNNIDDTVIPDITQHKRSHRLKSGCTWKTWRNVNESDAYSDVKKYIEDNELMNSEKESWIKAWICEVERALCTTDSHSETDSV